MSNIILMNKSYNDELALPTVMNYCIGNHSTKKKCFSWGGTGVDTSNIDTAINDMYKVKNYFSKTNGKQLYHIVITIYSDTDSVDENYLKRKYKKESNICDAIVKPISKLIYDMGFQNCFFRHGDSSIVHAHFVINSVNWMDGRKLTNFKSFVFAIKQFALRQLYVNLGELVYRTGEEIE